MKSSIIFKANLSLKTARVIILLESDLSLFMQSKRVELHPCGVVVRRRSDSCGMRRGWNVAVPHRDEGSVPGVPMLPQTVVFPGYLEALNFWLYFHLGEHKKVFDISNVQFYVLHQQGQLRMFILREFEVWLYFGCVFFPCLSIKKTICSQVPMFVSYQLKVYLNPFVDKE